MRDFIPVYEPELGGKELEYVSDCITSGWISSLGKYVVQFEEGFAQFCGVKHGIATANGTVALHLALMSVEIGKEDEVLVPSLTFVATANAVAYTGAKPIFVDSDKTTWNIDPGKIKEKITARTKAIIVVHLYGHPADMAPIWEVASKHNLRVIEDAAEAHGAEYEGRRVGSLGDVACFSFYGNKIVTTGEGGMVVTNESVIAERVRFLRDQAMSMHRRYWHPEIGYNYRLTNVQAAIGVAQLERIVETLRRKREISQQYGSLLKGVDGITLPSEQSWAKSVYWMYSILVEESYPLGRDELMLRLRENRIDSRPFFHPMHLMPPYRCDETFPIAEELSIKGINLPSSTTLLRDEIERIACLIRIWSK